MFKRTRWKPVTFLAAIVVFGVGTLCLIFRSAHDRKEFIGSIDRASGYRCRFSVSSGFQRTDDNTQGTTAFTEAPPNPLGRYLESILPFRTQSGSSTISFVHFPANRLPAIPIQNGYPAPVLQWRGKLLLRSHLQIDQCPATMITYDAYGKDTTIRCMDLYIYVPDGKLWYEVSGYNSQWVMSSGGNLAAFNAEMRAVFASVHVEKVAISPGSK